ncbi:peptidase domain-containing ABC transporter [Undibacterium sp. CY18W]|uniref:Peptidase domain-containing ABC transporter n=1 Tax=Undibacterium hunanense TaxID=2762292 RepID=A0ABR6ZWY9_9BURK|nr:peptidase domain-containing ABC transporter [Undibacterium hunanense]MBC3920070.1 peptidase domain-containing ABC transporter [Undibacterium hunanense]
MKIVFQSEAAECGLACLTMIANWHGNGLDVVQLRNRVGASPRGMSLRRLVAAADTIGLIAAPMRMGLDALKAINKPCILHWDFDHFVVMRSFSRGRFEIYDPATGVRRLLPEEVSPHFTGVVVEFSKATSFMPETPRIQLRISQYFAQTQGLLRSLMGIGIIALALELCSLLGPLYMQFVIDNVVSSADFDLLTVFAIGFGLILSLQAMLAYLRSWTILILTQDLALQWATNIFAHLIKLPMEFFERRRLGDIVSRFGSIGAIQQALTVSVLEAILDGVMALASLVVMLFYSPMLSFISISALLAQGLARLVVYNNLERMSKERLVIAAKESTYFLETVRAMLPLKLFNNEMQRRQNWQGLMRGVQQLDLRKGKVDIALGSVVAYIGALENIIVIWAGARLALSGEPSSYFTIGMLIVFLSYKMQFLQRTNSILKFLVDFKMIRMHSERLADIVLTAPEPMIEKADLTHLPAMIELRNISFRYDCGEAWVLRNVNCCIREGESVALTGPSGEGKTTLVKIILGLLTPIEGEVLYGGVRIETLGIKNVRGMIGTVMQEDVLLTGTIQENITFFDNEVSTEFVQSCAQIAHIHDAIQRMPMGYHTLVGDLGSGLSGGQKQRLLLARALCKRPRVLVLDEATSHLDAENEAGVNNALADLSLTRIVVAHRPSTIAFANRVLNVANGLVNEKVIVPHRGTSKVATESSPV